MAHTKSHCPSQVTSLQMEKEQFIRAALDYSAPVPKVRKLVQRPSQRLIRAMFAQRRRYARIGLRRSDAPAAALT